MLKDAYEALGEHYMTAIMPAQVRKPKQKASAEGTVKDAATWVIAQLRNRAFADLDEVVSRGAGIPTVPSTEETTARGRLARSRAVRLRAKTCYPIKVFT